MTEILVNSHTNMLNKVKHFMRDRFNISMSYKIFEVNENQINHYLTSYINATIPDEIKNASLKRRVEFLAGRVCAVSAMRLHGKMPVIQPGINADRSPLWPPNTTGSISHSKKIAVAAVGHKENCDSIGIDIEQIAHVKVAEQLISKITSYGEIENIVLPNLNMQEIFSAIFSSKESLFKAIYPQVNKFFYFSDVQCIKILPESNQWSMKLTRNLSKLHYAGRVYNGLYFMDNQYIISFVVL